jgi:hypothetical protein
MSNASPVIPVGMTEIIILEFDFHYSLHIMERPDTLELAFVYIFPNAAISLNQHSSFPWDKTCSRIVVPYNTFIT